MRKNKQKQAVSPEHEMELTLDDLVRRGARQVIQQAIETELAELLVSCANVRTLQGKQAVVRNGYASTHILSKMDRYSSERNYMNNCFYGTGDGSRTSNPLITNY